MTRATSPAIHDYAYRYVTLRYFTIRDYTCLRSCTCQRCSFIKGFPCTASLVCSSPTRLCCHLVINCCTRVWRHNDIDFTLLVIGKIVHSINIITIGKTLTGRCAVGITTRLSVKCVLHSIVYSTD